MKLFDNNKLTRKQLRREVCIVAKSLGVNRVAFNDKAKFVCGSYNFRNKNIFIDTKQNKREMLNTFFHELAHHTAVKNRKWLPYHTNPSTPNLTALRKFNIENGIDKIARTLWNKYVDTKVWGKYKYGYPKTQKQYLVNNFFSKF